MAEERWVLHLQDLDVVNSLVGDTDLSVSIEIGDPFMEPGVKF